jgi:carboxypeptidase PM20D1
LSLSREGLTTRASEHLSSAIRFKTVSNDDPSKEDLDEFRSFHAFLETAYPLVHSRLEREVVGEASLLYTWRGSEDEARSVLLAAHIDVVPVEPGTLDDWTHPPFDGVAADGFIWGRGTLDCKGPLIAILETIETLLDEGYEPDRTVFLAFGQDEELGGRRGAAKIAELLESRGASPELVIDEGGALVQLGIPGFKKPIAGVGIAEKGYLTVDVEARADGGHSSMPPRHTAIGLLARAITRLERHQFPPSVGAIPAMTLERLMPELPLYLRIALGNARFTGILMKVASRWFAPLSAMLRTTTAATMIRGGTKDNVLPQEASATVNLRLLPGESCESAMSRARKVIGDLGVSVKISGLAENPTRISNLDSPGFNILERTIGEMFPEAVVAPYLVIGMTDSRYYGRISDSVFRFCPIRGSAEEQDLPHGTDERIRVDNFVEFIEFYERLIRNSSLPSA